MACGWEVASSCLMLLVCPALCTPAIIRTRTLGLRPISKHSRNLGHGTVLSQRNVNVTLSEFSFNPQRRNLSCDIVLETFGWGSSESQGNPAPLALTKQKSSRGSNLDSLTRPRLWFIKKIDAGIECSDF